MLPVIALLPFARPGVETPRPAAGYRQPPWRKNPPGSISAACLPRFDPLNKTWHRSTLNSEKARSPTPSRPAAPPPQPPPTKPPPPPRRKPPPRTPPPPTPPPRVPVRRNILRAGQDETF